MGINPCRRARWSGTALPVRSPCGTGLARPNVTPFGMVVEDNIIDDVVSQLEESRQYPRRRGEIDLFKQTSRFLKKGIALTPVNVGMAFTLNELKQAGA